MADKLLVSSWTPTLFDQGGGVLGIREPDGIVSVTGTISDGSVITIDGGGFGSGPTTVYFENYSNGTLGSDITIANTIFDDTTSGDSNFAIRDADSRSGSFSANPFQENGGATAWVGHGLTRTFPAATEVFFSHAVKIPSGAYFPGGTTEGSGNSGTNADYPDSSNWKTAWLTNGNTTDKNDVVMITNTGFGTWQHQGNDLGTLRNWGTDPTWWEWTKWNRLTTWFKAGDTPNVDAGILYFQVANTVDTLFTDTTTPVIFANGTSPYQWTDIRTPSFIRSLTTQEGVVVLFDDIYIATGDNAAARVELGNNSSYTSCTDLAICDRVTWTGSQIVANVREGGLNLAAATWLFVVTADNTVLDSVQVVTP